MLNALWLGLVVAAVLLGAFNGKLADIGPAAFDSAKNAVMQIALPLAGLMALWLGMMRLAEKAGLIQKLALFLRPALARLFPDVPPSHPAMGAMVMNMAANMLGLSNAATPLGLRAMRDLEKINPHPGFASNAMCVFLAINTSSVQLIPATAVAILAAAGSLRPTAIIGTAFVATLCSTISGLVAVKFLERLPAYRLPSPDPDRIREISVECGRIEQEESAAAPSLSPSRRIILLAFFVAMAFAAFSLCGEFLDGGKSFPIAAVETLSVVAIPFLFAFFPLFAALKHVAVYEEFVEGAKEGIDVALRIIPFLVAILAAIAMFRAAGGIDLLSQVLAGFLRLLGVPAEILPLLIVRPLSGSGAIGIFSEIVQAHGPDSFVARVAATVIGSTETTFYVIAVYFGSVAIRRTRHAVPAGLIADGTGMIAAILICRAVFL